MLTENETKLLELFKATNKGERKRLARSFITTVETWVVGEFGKDVHTALCEVVEDRLCRSKIYFEALKVKLASLS